MDYPKQNDLENIMTTLTHYVSLTDALKRDMMRNVTGNQSEALTLSAIFKGIVHGHYGICRNIFPK